MTYYRELARASDRARRVGWESLAMQTLRFEAVAARLHTDDSVLDLGAGLGDFGRFLAGRGHVGPYVGVDIDRDLVAEGQRADPHVELVCEDALTTQRRARAVVAIGALVDGSSLTSDAIRFGRLRQIFSAVRGSCERVGLVVVAKQEAIEARPVLRADPALGGMRHAELAWLAPDAEIVDLSPLDWLVVLAPRGA